MPPQQVVPSLGQMKVLHRRLASPAQPGGAQPFPQLAQGWAASHRGKAFIDQVGGWGEDALLSHARWPSVQLWRMPSMQWWHFAAATTSTAVAATGALYVHCRYPSKRLLLGVACRSGCCSQVVYDRLGLQQALTLLRQHLTANLVRLRRRWCAQSRGIAQGSTLSTLLCRWAG